MQNLRTKEKKRNSFKTFNSNSKRKGKGEANEVSQKKEALRDDTIHTHLNKEENRKLAGFYFMEKDWVTVNRRMGEGGEK